MGISSHNFPATGTIRLNHPVPENETIKFYRAGWNLPCPPCRRWAEVSAD
jgi:hypothetical protein